MAAVSTTQIQRRKNLVYGKKSAYNKVNVTAFFDDDDELSVQAPTTARLPSVKSTYAVQKSEVKAHAPKDPTRPLLTRKDTFDVPLSDDEDEEDLPVKSISPIKFRQKGRLVDDTDTSEASLAPWERKTKGRSPALSPDSQLKQDLRRALHSPGSSKALAPSPKGKTEQLHTGVISSASPARNKDASNASAAARLAARRKAEAPAKAKRPVPLTEDAYVTPRKRVRTAPEGRDGATDVIMKDGFSAPTCEQFVERAEVVSPPADTYDFREAGPEESTSPRPAVQRQPRMVKGAPRRTKSKAYSSKTTPRKGLSAQARLSEMIPTDTDTTEGTSAWSPSSTSRKSTPHQPSTPPSQCIGSPQTAIKAAGTMTPKQVQLWDRLLPDQPVAPSPSALPIKDLSISGKRRTGTSSLVHKLTKAQSDVPRPRTRLVDRLKASRPSSDHESSDESDESAADIMDVQQVDKVPATVSEETPATNSRPSQASQSQNRSIPAATSGPKITYSTMRSYLPEDSFEAGLMAGLTSDTPERPAIAGKVVFQQPHKSAFDLEDSDDEISGAGKIRTIHELRASGRHMTGMYDVEELFSEIHNHSQAHRNRRRSALVELATKLCDKTFAIRFTSQSFETKLASECGKVSDEIADFLLTAAFALIMASKPPEHTVRTLNDQGVLSWLVSLLENDNEITKLAKDRSNNMSKSSQAALRDFVVLLTKQTILWDEESLSAAMYPRVIALKALDQIIRELRHFGDKTELLMAEQLLLVLPSNHALKHTGRLDTALSISILESLSTATLSLAWPSAIVKCIASALIQLSQVATPEERHSLFLTLRLCLNLTNENVPNCRVLAKEPGVVPFLLTTVQDGFGTLTSEEDDEKRTVALDLLVLAMGIMINLTENCDVAMQHALHVPDELSSLIDIFQKGQKTMLEVESVEESFSNVAFGYLAVMLANLCLRKDSKDFISSQLPGKDLGMLVEAVGEFVRHHEKVDTMNFEGEEGTAVWGAFTEKLRTVLARLKEADLEV